MPCRHCGHDAGDHGDRALVACYVAPPGFAITSTVLTLAERDSRNRRQAGERCNCPGYEAKT